MVSEQEVELMQKMCNLLLVDFFKIKEISSKKIPEQFAASADMICCILATYMNTLVDEDSYEDFLGQLSRRVLEGLKYSRNIIN